MSYNDQIINSVGPKIAFTLPCIPFICYNYMRNKCRKTENTNYIC